MINFKKERSSIGNVNRHQPGSDVQMMRNHRPLRSMCIVITADCIEVSNRQARHCTGKVGGGGNAGILVQPVTHLRQTSLVTSQPARRNYKTGRAGALRAAVAVAAQWRVRCRPTPTRHRRFTYRGRRHDAERRFPGRGRGGLEHAANGATERGRRCSERSSLRARRRATRASSPRAALHRRAPSTHQNDEFIFRAYCEPDSRQFGDSDRCFQFQ